MYNVDLVRKFIVILNSRPVRINETELNGNIYEMNERKERLKSKQETSESNLIIMPQVFRNENIYVKFKTGA